MNRKIIVIGDQHWKNKEPFKSATIEFFIDLQKKYLKDVLIFTGDFFDTASSHFDEVMRLAVEHLLPFSEVHIISGNHECNNKRVGNPLSMLNQFSNIKTYLEKTEVNIEGKKFLMLPYLYSLKELKEYEKLTGDYDYVVSHVAYPNTNGGASDELDLSKINSKYFFYGHIHEPQDFGNHSIIGVPLTTRYDERSWKKRIVVIENDEVSFEELSDYITYETIKFGEEPKNKNSILNVINSPSVNSVRERYEGYHLRLQGIELNEENSVEKVSYEEQKDFMNFNLLNNFKSFLAENEQSDKRIESTILGYFSKVGV